MITEVVKQKGLEHITVDDLVAEITPKGRGQYLIKQILPSKRAYQFVHSSHRQLKLKIFLFIIRIFYSIIIRFVTVAILHFLNRLFGFKFLSVIRVKYLHLPLTTFD